MGQVAIEFNQQYYQPALDYVGTDTILYSVSDGQGGSALATLTINIIANTAPVAADDSAAINEGESIVIDVLANDSDAENDSLTVTSAEAENGTVVINTDSTLTYNVNEGFTGEDTIVYTIVDAQGGIAMGSVSVTVTAAPPPPPAPAPAPTTPDVAKSSSGGGLIYWLLWISLMLIGFRNAQTYLRR